MIALTNPVRPGYTLYCGKLQARLAVHLKLDLIVWAAMRRYLSVHDGDSTYWMRHCQPFMLLLREHYRLTQLTSRPLSHYRQHVEKMALRYPRRNPTTKRARALLAMSETWYWREYD